MKKAFKLIVALLTLGVLFSSCDLNLLIGESDGSVYVPVSITDTPHYGYIAGGSSYYSFYAPANAKFLDLSTTEVDIDLDYFLYTEDFFGTKVAENTQSDTPTVGVVLEHVSLTPGTRYYLEVKNCSFSTNLRSYALDFNYTYSKQTIETVAPAVYASISNWNQYTLSAGETLWFRIDATSVNSDIYIHWQDLYDKSFRSNTSIADIRVTVYSPGGVYAIAGPADHGYSGGFDYYGSGEGLRVSGETSYIIKVENYSDTNSGYFYIVAVED